MPKTHVLPKKVKSRSSGIKPFLYSAKTAFPNMMRRVTQTAKDWGRKQKHSEMLKPYLSNDPYPLLDDTWPTPLGLEMPNHPGGEWSDVNYSGEDLYRFQCDIRCDRIIRRGDNCDAPIRCSYGAWTVLPDGNVKGWQLIDSDKNDITDLVTITWHPGKGLSGEIWIEPKGSTTWATILNDDKERLIAIFHDKGSAITTHRWHPIAQRWFTLVPGKSVCDAWTLIECAECDCPPGVAFSYDDPTSSDTIAPSGTATVAVTAGGGGPYTWSVTGTGYSLPATTDTLTNTLSADAGSCGLATITITDCCGTGVTGYVRNTTGSWRDTNYCTDTCAGVTGTCGIAIRNVGRYRFKRYCGCWGTAANQACQGMCGSPTECLTNGFDLPGVPGRMDRCQWGCAGEDSACGF